MTTYAAVIAARLQRREDEDMDESVWRDDDRIDKLAEEVARLAEQLREATNAPRVEENDTRVVELERQLVAAREEKAAAYEAAGELERQLEQMSEQAGLIASERDRAHEHLAEAERRLESREEGERQRVEQGEVAELQAARDLLATAYVPREVPWSDVAAGMMTIARDGTPWMVAEYDGLGTWVLSNGLKEFYKNPAEGETVRVLVPYVTPEAAEAAVRVQLGGVPLDQDPVHGEVG